MADFLSAVRFVCLSFGQLGHQSLDVFLDCFGRNHRPIAFDGFSLSVNEKLGEVPFDALSTHYTAGSGFQVLI